MGMVREYASVGDLKFAELKSLLETNFDGYVTLLLNQEKPAASVTSRVSQTSFWYVDARGELIGTIRLRHALTQSLRSDGGHIGYDVRPQARNKGYATQMLHAVLEEARKLGLAEVLLTCAADNTPSARVIEKCGGILEKEAFCPETGKMSRYYWIKLAPAR